MYYPFAILCYNNQCFKIRLKKEIYKRITNDLNYAILKFSLNYDVHLNYVRKRAIEEWLNLSRV